MKTNFEFKSNCQLCCNMLNCLLLVVKNSSNTQTLLIEALFCNQKKCCYGTLKGKVTQKYRRVKIIIFTMKMMSTIRVYVTFLPTVTD